MNREVRSNDDSTVRRPKYCLRGFWAKVASRVPKGVGPAVELLRLKHAREVTAIFLDAHSRGRSLGKEAFRRIYLDENLCARWDTAARMQESFREDDGRILGILLKELLDGQPLRQLLPDSVGVFLDGKGPCPSMSVWAAGLEQAHARMRRLAQLGGVGCELPHVVQHLRPNYRPHWRRRLTVVLVAAVIGAFFSAIAFTCGVARLGPPGEVGATISTTADAEQSTPPPGQGVSIPNVENETAGAAARPVPDRVPSSRRDKTDSSPLQPKPSISSQTRQTTLPSGGLKTSPSPKQPLTGQPKATKRAAAGATEAATSPTPQTVPTPVPAPKKPVPPVAQPPEPPPASHSAASPHPLPRVAGEASNGRAAAASVPADAPGPDARTEPPKPELPKPEPPKPQPPTSEPSASRLTATWIADPATTGQATLKLACDGREAVVPLVRVVPGTFSMGSQERPDESPIRSVAVQEFYIGKCEVTVAQLRVVLGDGATDTGQSSQLPAHGIPWAQAKAFCAAVGQALKGQVREVRLPWEFEWEYVAQLAPVSEPAQLNRIAWIDEDPSEAAPHPVGQKEAHPRGIHDLFGNVAEWVQDAYSETAYLSADPHGRVEGERGIVRGGSCISQRLEIRPSARFAVPRDRPHVLIGFRVVIVP